MFLEIPAPALRVLPSLTTSSPAVPASARAGQWGHYGAILLRTTQHLNKLFPKNTTFMGDDMRLIVVMVWWPPLSPVFPAQGPAHINNVWLSVASQLLRCIPVLATQFNLAPPGASLILGPEHYHGEQRAETIRPIMNYLIKKFRLAVCHLNLKSGAYRPSVLSPRQGNDLVNLQWRPIW